MILVSVDKTIPQTIHKENLVHCYEGGGQQKIDTPKRARTKIKGSSKGRLQKVYLILYEHGDGAPQHFEHCARDKN